MRLKLLCAAVMTASLMGIAAPAAAQSKEDVEKAQGHFARGAEKFAAGEYAKAVAEFVSGHAIVPNAMFLYNISLCYERLDRLEDALSNAEKAQKFEGMSAEVALRNKSRIAAFKVQIRTLEVADDVAKLVAEAPEDPIENPGDEPRVVRQSDGITIIGWSGLAIAAIGGGLVVGGVATNSAIVKDIEIYEQAAADGDRATYDEVGSRIETRQSTGKILYGVGCGAIGLGATLFIVDLLTGTEEVPVTVSPTPDGAMVTGVLRF